MYYDETFQGVAKCSAGCQLNVNPLVPIDGNELWVHPGGDAVLGLTVVQFTAAFSATYDLEYRFEDIDPSTSGERYLQKVCKQSGGVPSL